MESPVKLIESVLSQPTSVIQYQAGRRLCELFPDQFVLECSTCGFDLDGFAEAGHASMLPSFDGVYGQIITAWRSCSANEIGGACATGETGLVRKPGNAFLRVTWKGNALGALQLKWAEPMGPQSICFLIAKSREVAEAFYTAVCEWSAIPHGQVMIFEQGNWRKDAALFAAIHGSTFDNLVLRPGLKDDLLTDVTQFFSRREVYVRYGIPWKRGILLVGPPGNGKTHAVKSLCHELGLPALYVRSLEPQYRFQVGEHANISRVFEVARQTAPCLLVLEDIDALLKPDNRSFFLNELDGFADNKGICVLATTNFPERLDPSILDRPSRFDRKYHFDLPGLAERVAYLSLWNDQQTPELRLTQLGLEAVSEATNGFSFAYLKELCLAACMAWINEGPTASMDDVAKSQALALTAQMRSSAGIAPGLPLNPEKEL